MFQLVHHCLGDLFACVSPVIENLVVSLLIGDHAAVVQLLSLQHESLGITDNLRFIRRSDEIAGTERQARQSRFAESKLFQAVEQRDRLTTAEFQIAVRDHTLQVFAAHRHVVVRRLVAEDVVEHHAARCRHDQCTWLVGFGSFADDAFVPRQTQLNFCMAIHLALGESEMQFRGRGQRQPFARPTWATQRGVVATHHNVLRRADDRSAVRRTENIVRRHHQGRRFDLGLDR